MTSYELLSANQNLIEIISKTKQTYQISDTLNYIKEYTRLSKERYKQEYIASYLSEMYKNSSRSVFRTVKSMKKYADI